MFGLDACVQAVLRGAPRFHRACGRVRLKCCDGGVIMQLRMHNLPCGACPAFYRLRVREGCGCPALDLAEVPCWQGEAALTCFLGGFTPENLTRRCVCLCMNGGPDGLIADGVLQPCRDGCIEPREWQRPCRNDWLEPCERQRPCRDSCLEPCERQRSCRDSCQEPYERQRPCRPQRAPCAPPCPAPMPRGCDFD